MSQMHLVQDERERNMPAFLLVSMLLHALMFLYAPLVVTGLFPSAQQGDQGGLTYVTLVEAPPTMQLRAAVQDAARRPQSMPAPRPRPEPAPTTQVQQPQTVAQVPQPTVTPNPAQARPAPAPAPVREPVDNLPQAASPSVSARPAPEPVRVSASPESPAAPTPTATRPEVDARAQANEPVLTSPTGSTAVAGSSSEAATQASPAQASASPASEGEPSRAEEEPQPAPAGPASESGTGAPSNVTSAAPNAEVAPEPVLPPAGESMVQRFGGSIFPKEMVGVLTSVLTVEVAVVVNPDGSVRYLEVVESSGIPFLDDYSILVARNLTYKAYDEMYEVSVFVSYNGPESTSTTRPGDFIRVPPTVGPFAR